MSSYGFTRVGIKKYYFTGSGFDDVFSKRKHYPTVTALKNASKKFIHILAASGYKFYIQVEKPPIKKIGKRPVKRPAIARKKNPVNDKARKIKRAIQGFEAFTGHTPEFIDKIDLPKSEVMFKIGACDGILYTTVRDGRTEHYVHEFKPASRPVLASNHDGKFVALIGGKYTFTERGIVDK